MSTGCLRRIRTTEDAEALPVGSIIADVTMPDHPSTAYKAAPGDWRFIGEVLEARYWTTLEFPVDDLRLVLLWLPEWASQVIE